MSSIRQYLINLYLNCTKDCPIRQLGPPFTFYYSEETKTNLLSRNLIEIDIKSAFPTICKMLFGANHPFVQNIFNIEDKLQRNIFISTTLTAQSKIDGEHYLNELNLWSKMLILAYTYINYENITLIEYVKDGLLIKGDLIHYNQNPYKLNLDKFIKENNIQFHEKEKRLYLRYNKTSILQNDRLKIKGLFHDPPPFFILTLKKFFENKLYDNKLLKELVKIYSNTYWQILYKAKLKDEINLYYKFQDGKYLDKQNKLTNDISKIYPKAYLRELYYPALSLLRSEHKANYM